MGVIFVVEINNLCMWMLIMRIANSLISTFLLRVAIIATLVFSGGVFAGAATANNGNNLLRIIYSGNLTGNIEPCG